MTMLYRGVLLGINKVRLPRSWCDSNQLNILCVYKCRKKKIYKKNGGIGFVQSFQRPPSPPPPSTIHFLCIPSPSLTQNYGRLQNENAWCLSVLVVRRNSLLEGCCWSSKATQCQLCIAAAIIIIAIIIIVICCGWDYYGSRIINSTFSFV